MRKYALFIFLLNIMGFLRLTYFFFLKVEFLLFPMRYSFI